MSLWASECHVWPSHARHVSSADNEMTSGSWGVDFRRIHLISQSVSLTVIVFESWSQSLRRQPISRHCPDAFGAGLQKISLSDGGAV